MMSWEQTLQEKITDLEMLASWASIVGYGTVRDNIRTAIYQLEQQLELWEQVNQKEKEKT